MLDFKNARRGETTRTCGAKKIRGSRSANPGVPTGWHGANRWAQVFFQVRRRGSSSRLLFLFRPERGVAELFGGEDRIEPDVELLGVLRLLDLLPDPLGDL